MEEPHPIEFYMVLNTATGYTNHRHNTRKSAENEAIRLAQLNPDCEIIVLKSLSTTKGFVSWSTKYHDSKTED